MNQTGNQPDGQSPQPSMNMSIALVGVEVGCLTLLVVFGALFGGLWLDRMLDTKPIFTILLLVGSAPLALVLTFWIAMRAVKKIPLPPPGSQSRVQYDDDEEED